MEPIHFDPSRFRCSRCETPTRCNDLIASDGPDREFCSDCLHVEALREIYQTDHRSNLLKNDQFTDLDHRRESPTPDPDPMADSEFSW